MYYSRTEKIQKIKIGNFSTSLDYTSKLFLCGNNVCILISVLSNKLTYHANSAVNIQIFPNIRKQLCTHTNKIHIFEFHRKSPFQISIRTMYSTHTLIILKLLMLLRPERKEGRERDSLKSNVLAKPICLYEKKVENPKEREREREMSWCFFFSLIDTLCVMKLYE